MCVVVRGSGCCLGTWLAWCLDCCLDGRWLVVLTILKNISQWEGLSHILWKIKTVPNHQPGRCGW